MIRKSMKTILCALLAAFTLSSIAEATPKKPLPHRPKHSSRVASGSSAANAKTPAAKKKTPSVSATKKKSGAAVHRSTTKKPARAKRRPTTKPR